MIEDMKQRSLEDVRAIYKKYMNEQNLSKNTISTSLSDAFYIWRKRNADTFWSIVSSEDFDTLGKNTLLELLRQQSDGNVESNVSDYMSHLRRFRRFLNSEYTFRISEKGSIMPTIRTNPSSNARHMLPPPSIEQVEYYLAQWDELEDYRLQEDALDRLFFNLCPYNEDISAILLKVSVLNDFYSTNIFKVFPVAKRILSLHIDDRLQHGDGTLVDDIKKVIISGRTLNFYSFATKYCSHHKPLDFPIYDSYVDEVLR